MKKMKIGDYRDAYIVNDYVSTKNHISYKIIKVVYVSKSNRTYITLKKEPGY
jgi:hypothetical protein